MTHSLLLLLLPFCRLKSTDGGEESAIWDSPLELGSATEGVDDADQNVPEEPLEFQPQLHLPDQLKDLKVRVSHVKSPSSFYVQFSQYDSQLKRSAVKNQNHDFKTSYM